MATLLTAADASVDLADDGKGCPACGESEVVPFLDLAGMPVFNNVLFADATSAMSAMTGDIRLAVCPQCGLISNQAFDPGKVNYSPAYENSLHASSTFSDWALGLASRLAADHDLVGGKVLEVGAGSGEFLAMLCELARCEGRGFDPSHDESDVRAAGSRVQVVLDAAPVDASPADLVLCRHVLEHVDDPVGFLREIRSYVRPHRKDRVPIYVEVPDAAYMIHEEAFWDVIYEHPLYFDEHALSRTFALAGMEITRTGRTFGNQYAWIEGLTDGDAGADRQRTGPIDVDACRRFSARFATCLATSSAVIAGSGGEVVVWGAGSKGVTFCNLVAGADRTTVVDVSPVKWRKHLPVTGQLVHAPEDLVGREVARVLVMNELYVDEIRANLAELGLRPELVVP